MKEYHKIHSIFKRTTDGKKMLFGEFSLPEFEYLKNNEWEFSEKVDGMNIRVCWDYVDCKITIKGKTDNAQIPSTLFDSLNEMFYAPMLKSVLPSDCNVCLYGEGYGSRIQSGGKYRNDQSFVLFDVMVGGETWLKRKDVEDMAKLLNIDVVPVIGIGTLDTMINLCKEGFKSKLGDFIAEGIVARPLCFLNNRLGRRIITKLKYKDFER